MVGGCANAEMGTSLHDDPRQLALSRMIEALALLDSDASISGIVGARLQSAIDALYVECGIEPPLPDFG